MWKRSISWCYLQEQVTDEYVLIILMRENLYKIAYQLKGVGHVLVRENELQLRKTTSSLMKVFSA